MGSFMFLLSNNYILAYFKVLVKLSSLFRYVATHINLSGVYYCRLTFTPPENALSCNSAVTGVLSFGRSNTRIPDTLLPGLIWFRNVLP